MEGNPADLPVCRCYIRLWLASPERSSECHLRHCFRNEPPLNHLPWNRKYLAFKFCMTDRRYHHHQHHYFRWLVSRMWCSSSPSSAGGARSQPLVAAPCVEHLLPFSRTAYRIPLFGKVADNSSILERPKDSAPTSTYAGPSSSHFTSAVNLRVNVIITG